jgi:HEAT repeat protein
MNKPLSIPISRHVLQQLAANRDTQGLIEALDYKKVQGSSGMRGLIMRKLGELGDPTAVEPVAKTLSGDPDAPTRAFAAKALGRLGDPAGIPALRRVLECGDSTANEMWAIRSLGQLKDRSSVDDLCELVGSGERGVRLFAVRALGEIGDQRATPALIDVLDDRRRAIRVAAADNLAKLGDSRALEHVRQAHSQASGFTRRRIGRALGEIETRFS